MASGGNDRSVFREANSANGKVLKAVEPYVRRRVLKLYGEKTESTRLCPGEANCDRWAGTNAKTHRERERKACKPCPLFDTKTDAAKKGHKSLDALSKRAMEVRVERQTGYPRRESMMSNKEFAALFLIEQLIEQEEIAIKDRTAKILMAAMGVKAE